MTLLRIKKAPKGPDGESVLIRVTRNDESDASVHGGLLSDGPPPDGACVIHRRNGRAANGGGWGGAGDPRIAPQYDNINKLLVCQVK